MPQSAAAIAALTVRVLRHAGTDSACNHEKKTLFMKLCRMTVIIPLVQLSPLKWNSWTAAGRYPPSEASTRVISHRMLHNANESVNCCTLGLILQPPCLHHLLTFDFIFYSVQDYVIYFTSILWKLTVPINSVPHKAWVAETYCRLFYSHSSFGKRFSSHDHGNQDCVAHHNIISPRSRALLTAEIVRLSIKTKLLSLYLRPLHTNIVLYSSVRLTSA